MTRTTPISEVDRQAAELSVIGRALAASAGTFSIGIAVCNSVPLRNHLIEKIKASTSGIEVLSIPEGLVDIYGWVVSQVADRKPAALFLTDMDRSIRSDDKVQMTLASLNASRDLWPHRFACPVVFWLPEYAATLLSTYARDFWSRKSHQFHFAAEPMALADGSLPQFSGDLDWVLNLDVDKKQFRIAELEQRIAEVGDPPVPGMILHVVSWWNELGALLLVTSRVGDSMRAFKRAMDLAEETTDKHWLGTILCNMGAAYADLGETRLAIESYEKALSIARKIGDRKGEGHALNNLGTVYKKLGETRRAIEHYEERLAIARDTADRRGEGSVLGNLGNAYASLGQTQPAIEYYDKQLAIACEIDDRRGEGIALGNLGATYARLGETRRAVEYYEKHLTIAREIGDRRGEGTALGNMGLAYAALGEIHRAIQYYQKALIVAQEANDKCSEGNILANLGVAYGILEDLLSARECFEKSLAIVRKAGDMQCEGRALWNMAVALDKLGIREEALAYAKEALAVYEAINDPHVAMVRQGLAKLEVNSGLD